MINKNEVSPGPPVGLCLWVTQSPTVIQFKNKTDATGIAYQQPTWPNG